jgi:hypothetical protein
MDKARIGNRTVSIRQQSIRFSLRNTRPSRNGDTDRKVAIVGVLAGHNTELSASGFIAVEQPNCLQLSRFSCCFFLNKGEDACEVCFRVGGFEGDLEAEELKDNEIGFRKHQTGE